MTPAIDLAKKHAITHTIHEYEHDANHASFGEEAAEKLGVPQAHVFKTLVIELDTKALAVCVIPVSHTLNLKAAAKAAKAKKAAMADKQAVQRSTGYVLGGVSPLGQKKRLLTLIDESANHFATIYVSAGKRGLEIELAPLDLQRLCSAQFAKIKNET
ncbi:MAG: Cys-tRNA(Pro) deacylase [Bermanella sp.]|nr:Cys-tRNA(Pro) deacylase [Bermanella sp.]|tara:strand:- start:360 stop:833 length:474 start_codon:yes stop_codon:yes gene_type:complete